MSINRTKFIHHGTFSSLGPPCTHACRKCPNLNYFLNPFIHQFQSRFFISQNHFKLRGRTIWRTHSVLHFLDCVLLHTKLFVYSTDGKLFGEKTKQNIEPTAQYIMTPTFLHVANSHHQILENKAFLLL